MQKRFLSFILSICVLLGMLSGVVFAEGLGIPQSDDGFYLLDSAEDLVWFANRVNENGDRAINARLEGDIDLSGVEWTPIGNGYDYENNGVVADTAYNGVFDGDGFTISNLNITTITYSSTEDKHYETYCQGLFGIIGKGGTVKNLTVSGEIKAQASGNEYVDAAKFIGGIAGINAGLILNCVNDVNVTGHYNVGGIAGAVGCQFAGCERVSGRVVNCINNGNITATSTSSAHGGGITGQLSFGEISYAVNHGTVLAPHKDKGNFSNVRIVGLGGIVGSGINADGSTVDRSYNDGQIGNLDGNYIAGIMGLSYCTKITNVYNKGTITGANYSGGLVGYMTGGSLENAYNSGSVNTSTGYLLVGSVYNAKVKNAYSVGTSSKLVGVDASSKNQEIDAKSTASLEAYMLGEAFLDTDELPQLDFSKAPNGGFEELEISEVELENGKITVSFKNELSSLNLTLKDFEIKAYVNGVEAELEGLELKQTKTNAVIKFDSVNAETELKVSVNGIEKSILTPQSDEWTDYRAACFKAGDGSKENPYVISNVSELALLAYKVNKGSDMKGEYFTVSNDIGLSGKRWNPIGSASKLEDNKYRGAAFNGIFDGNNYSITDVLVDDEAFATGLFGLCEEDSVIKNVKIYGSIKNSDKSGHAGTGAIAGISYGTVYHCINYAEVNGTSAVGGIVGKSGAVNKTVTTCYIYRCGNEGKIIGDDEVGGIAAYNSGSVDECYNNGTVTARNGYAGGIVGYNYEGSILLANSYNSGKVSGNTYAGGVSGKAYKSEIKNSYNVGDVSAVSEKCGGILGYTVSDYNTVNCYYLEGTANMPYAENEGNGYEIKTSDELKALAAKLGDSFERSDEYPILKWENASQSELADETEGLDIAEMTVENGEIKLVMNKLLVMTKLSDKDFEISGIKSNSFKQSSENGRTVVTVLFDEILASSENRSILVSVSYGENTAKTAVLTVEADSFSVAPEYNANGVWSDFAAASFDSGAGTKESPYIIKTAEQLAYLAKSVNGGEKCDDVYYKLGNSLNLTDKLWTPIGTEENAFGGNFDGDGCEITLNCDGTAAAAGLFGYTDGAEIKMLGVSGLSRTDGDFSGALAGFAKNTVFENCYSAAYACASEYAGGIVGAAASGCKFTNCYAAGYARAKNAGMLFGHFANGVSVKNLFYRSSNALGVVGENASTNTTVAEGKTDVYMQSDAFANDLWLVKSKKVNGKTVKVAPVFSVGEKYPVLRDGFADSKVVSVGVTTPGASLEVGAEHKFIFTVYGKNIEKLSNVSWGASEGVEITSKQEKLSVSNGIGKAEAVVVIDDSVGKNVILGITCKIGGEIAECTFKTVDSPWNGKGTEKEPFEISSLSDMKALSEFVANGNTYAGAYFKMTCDIDMTDDEAFDSIGKWVGIKSDESGAWWENEENRSFCGTFDGDGHSIKNAVLDANNNHYGLFSNIGVGGTVENLVIDSTVKVKAHNNLNYIGALCGANFGAIKNCTNNADMNFTAAGIYNLSGICGQNFGLIESCVNNSALSTKAQSKAGICGLNFGAVKACENNGSISNVNYGGGIVVENRNGTNQPIMLIDRFAGLKLNAEITSCVNNADISASEDCGGIVAANYSLGLIEKCENNGSVSGRMAGGIAGRSSGCYLVGGIKNSVNNGDVFANGYGGGIIGEQINGMVYFCKNNGSVCGKNYGGGIAGRNYSSTTIGASAVEFSENYGTVTGNGGGIVGYYRDESGECYVRYNYSRAESPFGVIGKLSSKYELDRVIAENTWVSDVLTSENDSSNGDLAGAILVTSKEADLYENDKVELSVGTSKLKVSESVRAVSNKPVKSSNEDVLRVDEQGNVRAVGVGRAYIYAMSNPYTYSAELMAVDANPDLAEDITVSFWLIGEENHGSGYVVDENTENTYNTWVPKKTYTMKKGDTVGDLFKKALDECGLKYQGLSNGYISKIQNENGDWLGEYSNGKYSGWMYTVNGSHPDVGLNEYVLSGGENVVWHYVNDYRKEVADWSGTGEFTAIDGEGLHNRWLEVDPMEEVGDEGENGGSENDSPSSFGGGNNGGSGGASSSAGEKADSETNADASQISHNFTDVESGSWYENAVDFVYKNSLFMGVNETEFAPFANMTRAMFVTVLYRLDGEEAVEASEFVDVERGSYYEAAVAWANKNGIVSGVSEREFAPNENITREQIAAIVYRYVEYKGVAPSGAWAIRLDYSDLEEISEYAFDGVMYCKLKGIMQGRDNNEFVPADNAARAEAAVIFEALSEVIK